MERLLQTEIVCGPASVGNAKHDELQSGRLKQLVLIVFAELGEARHAISPRLDCVNRLNQTVVELLHHDRRRQLVFLARQTILQT